MKQLITSSKTLKPLLRQVLQAPWASPLMEFRYGIWVGVSGLMGVDGRQLGEANTRPVVFNRNIPAEVQSCKYKGTRCLLYTSPSPRDRTRSRMPSSA